MGNYLSWLVSLRENTPVKVFGEYEAICNVPCEPNQHFTQKDLSAWSEWEMWTREIPKHLKSGNIRKTLDQLPEFPWKSIVKADIQKYINLAFVLLAFAVNAYIRVPYYQQAVNDGFSKHVTDPLATLPYDQESFDTTPLAFLPDKYAIPIQRITERLETAPLLSYPAVAVLNFECVKTGRNLSLDDFDVRYTFTGESDEKYFYTIPIYIDYLGTFIRESMDGLFEEVKGKAEEMLTSDGEAKVIAYLDNIKKHCIQIQKELSKIWKSCQK